MRQKQDDVKDQRLLYRYRPDRAVKVDLVFIALMMAACIYIIMGPPHPLLMVIPFFVSLIALRDLLFRNAVISFKVVDSKIQYRYSAPLKRITRTFSREDIQDIRPETTSLYRGRRTERLVMELKSGMVLVVCPYYSVEDPEIGDLIASLRGV
ncbi:MAG: hypothetical protein GF388_11015 [Candidatus Aegiribacteria sp.]|nr:hypothetical protein [Candidatus Aegiribacteria sp.]MBD3295529.1 hypothetical protein [Candidatus Fermentibacteria bacterium]